MVVNASDIEKTTGKEVEKLFETNSYLMTAAGTRTLEINANVVTFILNNIGGPPPVNTYSVEFFKNSGNVKTDLVTFYKGITFKFKKPIFKIKFSWTAGAGRVLTIIYSNDVDDIREVAI